MTKAPAVRTGVGGSVPFTLCLLLSLLSSRAAHAQRSSEDAVAEAADAFGMTVGREAIGLYSDTSARGFDPMEAGNLRIDGLYFDEVSELAEPPTRIVRSAAVHVGIAAQGYLFPAPTGVVDYQLRTPGSASVISTLNGYASYGVYYDETDFSAPIMPDVLSVGGGIGYTHNLTYNISASSDDWTAGFVARWQPIHSLVITPFWGMTHRIEYGERPYVFIDDSGVPRYRAFSLGAQPWADWSFLRQDFGTTAHLSFDEGWLLAAGVFRSLAYQPTTYSPLLVGVGSLDRGDYQLSAFPANSAGSTSGEVRLAKLFGDESCTRPCTCASPDVIRVSNRAVTALSTSALGPRLIRRPRNPASTLRPPPMCRVSNGHRGSLIAAFGRTLRSSPSGCRRCFISVPCRSRSARRSTTAPARGCSAPRHPAT